YLPNQQYTLETLGSQMTFSNKAARYLNEIIQHAVSFQTADVYYSLGMYLRQMNQQVFPEVISRAYDTVKQEIERSRADLFHCKKALEEINKLATSVKADTELTSSQRAELLETLASYAFEFKNLHHNLSNVYVMISKVQISGVKNPDDVDEAFTANIGTKDFDTWIQQLTTFESAVIEGGRNGVMPGGEQQVLQSLESKQQDYTSFNQNQQLALQMESAAIQQEWTMVAAALALMNQIFAKLIRRFK
ncbi:CT620/CT621 family type III secretion system effector, partial [Chlamydia suis]